jgi:hypothetical protein
MPKNSPQQTLTPSCRALSVRKAPNHEKSNRLGETRAGCDLTKALSLAGNLEDEEIIRKIEERK